MVCAIDCTESEEEQWLESLNGLRQRPDIVAIF